MAGTASLAIVACSESLLRLARRRNLRGRGVLVLTPPTELIDERINMEPTKLDKIIENYAEKNGIIYELRAVTSDGEVLARYESSLEAADVAGYAGLLDEAIMNMALHDANTDDDDDTQLDEMINRGEWQPALDSLTVVRKG